VASIEAVVEALTRMDLAGLAGARKLTDDAKELRSEIYVEALADLSDADLKAAVLLAIRSARPYYPTPGQLLELVRPQVVVSAAITESAARDYENIVSLFEQGREPILSTMPQRVRVAFAAAGGRDAFEWCEPKDRPFRLKRWTDAYVEAATAQGAQRAALEAGADQHAMLAEGFSRAEAASVLGKLIKAAPAISTGEVE
jgi:hypothetical protein